MSIPSTTHSLPSSLSTSVGRGTSTCLSIWSSLYVSHFSPSLVGKLIPPVVSTSQSITYTSISTYTCTSATSMVDELFCPWNSSLVSTPFTNSLSLPLHLIFLMNFFPMDFVGVPSVRASFSSSIPLFSIVDELFSPWMQHSQPTPSTSISTLLSLSVSCSSPSFLDELFE